MPQIHSAIAFSLRVLWRGLALPSCDQPGKKPWTSKKYVFHWHKKKTHVFSPSCSLSLSYIYHICVLTNVSSSMPFITAEAISLEELVPWKSRFCPFKPGKNAQRTRSTIVEHTALVSIRFSFSLFPLHPGESPQAIRILLFLNYTNNQSKGEKKSCENVFRISSWRCFLVLLSPGTVHGQPCVYDPPHTANQENAGHAMWAGNIPVKFQNLPWWQGSFSFENLKLWGRGESPISRPKRHLFLPSGDGAISGGTDYWGRVFSGKAGGVIISLQTFIQTSVELFDFFLSQGFSSCSRILSSYLIPQQLPHLPWRTDEIRRREWPQLSRILPLPALRPRVLTRAFRAVTLRGAGCPTGIWDPAVPTPTSMELPESLGSRGRAPLSKEPQTVCTISDRRPRSQPGAWRPFSSQPEPNEICTSHNLSSQTRWHLPIHIFVFLRGADLKKREKKSSNGEKRISKHSQRTLCVSALH